MPAFPALLHPQPTCLVRTRPAHVGPGGPARQGNRRRGPRQGVDQLLEDRSDTDAVGLRGRPEGGRVLDQPGQLSHRSTGLANCLCLGRRSCGLTTEDVVPQPGLAGKGLDELHVRRRTTRRARPHLGQHTEVEAGQASELLGRFMPRPAPRPCPDRAPQSGCRGRRGCRGRPWW